MAETSPPALRFEYEVRESFEVADLARLSERAGRAIMRVYESGDAGAQTKGDGSPLTLADTASHAVIARGLAALAPHIPVVSEEGGRPAPFEVRKGYRYCWVVDPLDGTKEFIKRNGEFTVMIGLVDSSGESVAGAVHVPCTGQTYYAARGTGAFLREGADMGAGAQERVEGAYKEAAEAAAAAAAGATSGGSGGDGKAAAAAASSSPSSSSPSAADKLHAAAAAAAADAGVTTRAIRCAEFSEQDEGLALVASASHLSPETEAFCRRFRSPAFSQVGSSLKMMRVAEGAAHCYPRLAPTMEWDTAAADVIVREAGGELLRAGSCDGKSGRLLPGVDWEAELARALPVAYNKPDLLNPYFVCWGKRRGAAA